MDCKPSDLTVSRIDKIREHLYTLKIKQIESKNVIKYILSYFLNKVDITDIQKINICKSHILSEKNIYFKMDSV